MRLIYGEKKLRFFSGQIVFTFFEILVSVFKKEKRNRRPMEEQHDIVIIVLCVVVIGSNT